MHGTNNFCAALLLKLEERVAEITIDSKELGFTRPGHYIYDFLSHLNITYETANMLIDTIDNAALLLEEGMDLKYCCFRSYAIMLFFFFNLFNSGFKA